MAKRQRRDSVQEAMIEHMDERKAKPKPKRHYTVVRVPVASLKEGDRIVHKVDRVSGRPSVTTEIKSIEIARGCGNFHINDDKCYDRIASVLISVPETVIFKEFMLPDGSVGSQEELLEALGY